jgi:tetrahydromethanopterin S-methyltransferase subunit F
MVIERTDSEIIVKIPAMTNVEDIQQLMDYLSYKSIVSRSQAAQPAIDALVETVKKGRWLKRRQRLVK